MYVFMDTLHAAVRRQTNALVHNNNNVYIGGFCQRQNILTLPPLPPPPPPPPARFPPHRAPPCQVIFSMTGLLVKFGVVMLVVMLGFVMSFYSLFQSAIEPTSYGQVRGKRAPSNTHTQRETKRNCGSGYGYTILRSIIYKKKWWASGYSCIYMIHTKKKKSGSGYGYIRIIYKRK